MSAPPGWYAFGTHVDQDVRLEFSEEAGEDGLPLWERPYPVVRQLRPELSGEEAAEIFEAHQPERLLGEGGVVQYLIHPALRPFLDNWLISRGMRIDQLPRDDEDAMSTFLISPRSL